MFQAVHEQLSEQPVLRTLNPQQNGMVTTISEIIIPQTDTPGAKAARVNEFIDLILTEWYDDEEKSIFLTGLAEVDTRTRDLFGKNFVDCGDRHANHRDVDRGLWIPDAALGLGLGRVRVGLRAGMVPRERPRETAGVSDF